MEPKTKPFSGTELLEAIEATGIEKSGKGFSCVYDTNDPEIMAKAQNILIENGYHMHECGMDEGHVYRQEFISYRNTEPPYSISVRFIVSGMRNAPRLMLMYLDGIVPVAFNISTVEKTNSPLARLLEDNFDRSHRGVDFFWMPVFEGSPFLP